MPLIRKVIRVGITSFAVIIPKSWLEYYNYPKKVEMSVRNGEIIIKPLVVKKK